VKPAVLMLLVAASLPLPTWASSPKTAAVSTEPVLSAMPARNCPATGDPALAGALVGAAVGGLSGAIWADANNDGCVDGYVREGRYYGGAPIVQPLPANYRSGEGS
jgi:hypothetical protein